MEQRDRAIEIRAAPTALHVTVKSTVPALAQITRFGGSLSLRR